MGASVVLDHHSDTVWVQCGFLSLVRYHNGRAFLINICMKMQEILTERYLNLFPGDPRREQYRDAVWDMLQKAYEPIGGVKGSGFLSPDDMVRRLPMWKLARKDGRIVAAVMYKDKAGRKAVAYATDESPEAAEVIADILPQEAQRSYAEKSKKALGAFMRVVPNARDHLFTFERAQSTSEDPLISLKEEWPPLSDDERDSVKYALTRWPFLWDYGYFREFGGEWHFKVMLGTPGLTITPP